MDNLTYTISKPSHLNFDLSNIDEKMREETYHYISLIILFCLSFGLMLFNYDGYFDNEWQFYIIPTDIQNSFWYDRRVPLVGYFYNLLFSLTTYGHPNAFIPFKILAFLCHLSIGLIFYSLLKKLDFIKKIDAFFLTALAITLPVQESKFLSIFLWYSMHLLIFMIAFWNLANAKTIIGRLITLSLFFVSFFLESLLVFYAIPMLYYSYLEREKWLQINIRDTAFMLSKWVLTKLDYFILPFAFSLKMIFWKITLWPDKSEIYFKNLIIGIPKTFMLSFLNFIEILNNSFTNFSAAVLIGAIVMIKFFPYKFIKYKSKSQLLILFFLGCLLFYLAFYPYIVVNMLPASEYADSRTQLLILFGASFILYYGMQYLLNVEFQKYFPIIFSIILALFVSVNINRIMTYQIHCTKTNIIIEKLKTLAVIKEGNDKTFVFIDNAKIFNLNHVKNTKWDVLNWLKVARGNFKYNNYDCFGFFDYENNIETKQNLNITGKIIINTKVTELSTLDKLRITLYNVFNKKNYYHFLDDIGFIELHYEPL